MRVPGWLKLRVGKRERKLENGTSLRLLTAQEVLEARREAMELAGEAREQALCSNACLLARAVTKRGRPAYASGREVLDRLTVQEIQRLARAWADFDREENPGLAAGKEQVERLKKAWSTRRRSG